MQLPEELDLGELEELIDIVRMRSDRSALSFYGAVAPEAAVRRRAPPSCQTGNSVVAIGCAFSTRSASSEVLVPHFAQTLTFAAPPNAPPKSKTNRLAQAARHKPL